MSLWWTWGSDATTVGATETNAPSKWGAGVKWSGSPPYAGYWQPSANPTDRTGTPDVAIAIAGALVNNTIRSASWQLGRSEWLSVLQPSSASLEFEGAVTFSVMDTVVINVMSDVTSEHSPALWVGYVDTINETTETSGRVTTSVSCIDVIGRLGQSAAPRNHDPLHYTNAGGGLAGWLQRVAATAGTRLVVEDDSLLAPDDNVNLDEFSDTILASFNQVEQNMNLNLFALVNGHLVVQRRWYVEAPDLDPAPTPVDLDADPPATWTTQLSPTSVINDWGEEYETFPITDDADAVEDGWETSREAYGLRTYGTPLQTGEWDLLIGTGVMNDPRLLLSSADFPITDLGDSALFLSPNDWVTLDGTTYQVLSVSHSVEPGHRWRVSITGDSTQVLLHEAFE